MKLLKKITIGTINGVRGGLKDIKGRVRIMTIVGVCTGYTEKTNETMGVSYAFKGEFRAINRDGEEAAAAVAYLPELAQNLLKQQVDNVPAGSSVEFGFHYYAVEDATALKGYYFECVPLMEARPSSALETLAARIGFAEVAANPTAPALGHDKPADPAPVSETVTESTEAPIKNGHAKKK